MTKNIIILLGVVIIISILFVVDSYSIPETPEEELEWCLKHKPQFNISYIKGVHTGLEKKTFQIQEKCFAVHWREYCKASYPEFCPKNNYSDRQRCLRRCIIYEMEDNCPCGD